MTPTHERPTLTFKVEMMVGKLAGKITSMNDCIAGSTKRL